MRRTLKLKKPDSTFSNVMLIDDSEMDNFINQNVIEAARFAERIYTTTNGLSALEFLTNLLVNKETLPSMVPEIVFVDLNMPLMNGFQFIKKFYELPKELTANCKIVILTSSLNPSDQETAQEINKDIVFLHKPLTTTSLTSIVS